MKKKEKKPVFTAEFALKTNKYQERKLNIKFSAMTSLYNQLLSHLLKHHIDLKNDENYTHTVELYVKNKKELIEAHNAFFKASAALKNALEAKKPDEKDIEEKQKKFDDAEKVIEDLKSVKADIQLKFKNLNILHQLDYAFLEKLSTSIKKNCWMNDHLDSQTIQKIAKVVYEPYEKWRYKSKGKPRFKTSARAIKSISGKQNTCISLNKKGQVKWKDVEIDIIKEKDTSGFQAYVNQKISEGKLKYSRIVRRTIKGKTRFFVQFIVEGKPFVKEKHKIDARVIGKTIGLDIGVSSVGFASAQGAFLFPLCPSVKDCHDEIKKIQRAMERSKRANNPDCFHDDEYVKKVKHTKKVKGKVKKNSKMKKRSQHYIKYQALLKDLYRKMEVSRNQEHYLLIHHLLNLGTMFKIEKNCFKAWQKSWFGRTIGKKAPSAFQEKLLSKAANAGGSVELISPYKPKFSQYCHICGLDHKKPLGQRVHICEGNGEAIAQCDVYSAFLIYHYDTKKGKHKATQEDFDLFKDLTLKYSTDYFNLFPQLKNNFSVNDMGEGVAGGKSDLTGEAKGCSFCATENGTFSMEESDL